MGTLFTIEPQPRRRAVKVAQRGACGTVLHGLALEPRQPRRVRPLLIVIGSDTAHVLARSDRPDTMPLHKIAKRKMPAAFGECPLSGKADVTADIARPVHSQAA
jgi:hypothetical protein